MTGSMPGMAASTSETFELLRLVPNSVEAPEKSFAFDSHLRMDFHADDDFPIAGGAGNEAFRIRRANVDNGHLMLFGGCSFQLVR